MDKRNNRERSRSQTNIIDPLKVSSLFSSYLPVSFIGSHPFWVFDKVTPAGPLGNPLWEDAVLDSLLGPLDDIRELGIFGEMVKVRAVGS